MTPLPNICLPVKTRRRIVLQIFLDIFRVHLVQLAFLAKCYGPDPMLLAILISQFKPCYFNIGQGLDQAAPKISEHCSLTAVSAKSWPKLHPHRSLTFPTV